MHHIYKWNHWVARTISPEAPFQDFEIARWMWTRIAERFPEAVSVVLMPNHIHLLLPKEGNSHSNVPTNVPNTFGNLLGSLTKRMKKQALWQPIPAPTLISDRMKLRRQIRYLALNPCRNNLCSDPVAWYWSTYREILGASVEGLKRREQIIKILGESERNFLVRFHAYVSGDPSVEVRGTPLPKSSEPRVLPFYSIGAILEASAAAFRILPTEIQTNSLCRSLFIHLAYRYGWRKPTLLGQICGLSKTGVHRAFTQTSPLGIEAAELCLGDSRLIRHPGQPQSELAGFKVLRPMT